MNMWEFFHHHPFLAWCALWGIWPAAWAVFLVVGTVHRGWCRLLRALTVMARGWPPAHLDADGDWKPVQEIAPPLESSQS